MPVIVWITKKGVQIPSKLQQSMYVNFQCTSTFVGMWISHLMNLSQLCDYFSNIFVTNAIWKTFGWKKIDKNLTHILTSNIQWIMISYKINLQKCGRSKKHLLSRFPGKNGLNV